LWQGSKIIRLPSVI